ncbi:MAG: peroxiredoxin family protein [Thermoleophilaceae bacterium]|nr:peroxiredoxin family protein [Thermoleophilaceae bacterium]
MPRVPLPRTPKQAFISLFAAASPLLAADALRRALRSPRGSRAAWLVAAWVHAVPSAFFARVFLTSVARTSPDLLGLQAATVAGAALLLPRARSHPAAAALATGEALATVAYARWYSRLDRDPSPALELGTILPADLPFSEHGRGPITANDLLGRPTVLMFYRGNWCPLCMAQIGEIAERWREVEALGAQVALVSPQHDDQTRALAARHDVSFRYLRDEDLRAAERLGIVHPNGTPAGIVGYDGDTVLPTVVITDAEGRIVYADQTDNYRVRPTPDTVLAALRGAGLAPADEVAAV